MIIRLRDRTPAAVILLAIAFSFAIMLAFPMFGQAQTLKDVPTVDATVAISAQPTALATAAATAEVATQVEPVTASGGGGASDADAVLVGTFTTTTVLVLAGLALLDRKPEGGQG